MLNNTEIQITNLLLRKEQIEQMPSGSFVEHNRWLLDAVEVLLQHQLELVKQLRDRGILR